MGIDSCLKIAKLTAAAGDMAPFPFIKGVAQCVVLVLEAIESAGKNGKDLQELAERIVTTLVVVRDTVIKHGPTSASCFKDICLDFQTCMVDLLTKLNSGRRDQRGIWQYLRATKISDNINNLRQRVQTIQDSFLIRTMTMTQLALSNVHDEVITGFSALTGSVAASERNITSTIKDNIEEIRTLGVQQSENMENLSTRLLQASRQRGLYKGVIWDIIPGDIHIIKPVTRSLKCSCTGIRYKVSYCTIENSNTQKIICEYQAHGNNGEDAMDLVQLDQALDFFIKTRHPNLAQIFGVCRSPSLPAIIFHGTTRIPFDHYVRNLPAKRHVQFYSELFQDLQSVSEVLTMESYGSYDKYAVFNMDEPYVNEHGKLVFGDLPCHSRYVLDPFQLSLEDGKYHVDHSPDCGYSTEALDSQVSRWMSSSSSQKRDLLNHYDAILFCHARRSVDDLSYTQTFNRHQLSPPQYEKRRWLGAVNNIHGPPYQDAFFYVPGSILTHQPQILLPTTIPPQDPNTLVGRVRPWSHKWDVSFTALGKEAVNLSFDNGSVSIGLSWFDVSRDVVITIRTRLGIENVQSWTAQTSKLYSCLRSRGYNDDFRPYLVDGVSFTVQIHPNGGGYGHWACRICNAQDQYHHALSLLITAPVINYQTNTIESWPVVSCSRVCGLDSLEEEDVFKVRVRGHGFYTQCQRRLTGILELNAEHGFNPARDGADVCEYFGWPLLETRDSSTGEWTLNGIVSQSSGPATVI